MHAFKQAAQPVANITPVQEIYLNALRALLNLEEIETGHLLNTTKNLLVRAAGKTHWTQLEDKDFTIIAPDLTIVRFESLYGDYTPSTIARKSPSQHPWVRDRVLISMITGHIHNLGTEHDKACLKRFCNQHDAIFTSKPDMRIV